MFRYGYNTCKKCKTKYQSWIRQSLISIELSCWWQSYFLSHPSFLGRNLPRAFLGRKPRSYLGCLLSITYNIKLNVKYVIHKLYYKWIVYYLWFCFTLRLIIYKINLLLYVWKGILVIVHEYSVITSNACCIYYNVPNRVDIHMYSNNIH